LDTVRRWKSEGQPLKFFTAWGNSGDFIGLADKIYLLDAEVAWSFGYHKEVTESLVESNKIYAVATETRAEQAYWRGIFGRDTTLIPPFCGKEHHWSGQPLPTPGLVGCFEEGPDTKKEVDEIVTYCVDHGVNIQIAKLGGPEQDVIDRMFECDFYIGLNPGKDAFNNEGLARSQLEAMCAGCVVIAYDVGGNREFIFDGYSGCLVPRYSPKSVAARICDLMNDSLLKEQIRTTSVDFAQRAFSAERCWPILRAFLELPLTDPPDARSIGQRFVNREELELFLGGPAYVGREEIPLYTEYASRVEGGTIVEIGAGYGASALLFLAGAPLSTKVRSIDCYTPDPTALAPRDHRQPLTAKMCVQNVVGGLEALGTPLPDDRWYLYTDYSHNIAQRWNDPIDLLYIDGDHSYEGVRRDFDDWFPYVRPGGIIFLHDSRREPDAPENEFKRGWQGPTQLAQELGEDQRVALVEEVFSLTVWRKK